MDEKKRSRKRKPGTAPRPPIVDKKAAFIAAFEACASIQRAASAVGINKWTHHDWAKHDPDYAAKFQTARLRAAEILEDEAVERALRGVFEPNVFQGRFTFEQEEVVTPAVTGPRGGVVEPERREWRERPDKPLGTWRKSDALLMFLLRGNMRDKYGAGALEVTGANGGPVEIIERLNAARARAARIIGEPAQSTDDDG